MGWTVDDLEHRRHGCRRTDRVKVQGLQAWQCVRVEVCSLGCDADCLRNMRMPFFFLWVPSYSYRKLSGIGAKPLTAFSFRVAMPFEGAESVAGEAQTDFLLLILLSLLLLISITIIMVAITIIIIITIAIIITILFFYFKKGSP